MSIKSALSIDNGNLKFLELKKYLISSEGTAGLNCISVDNSRQNVFVSNGANLLAIDLNYLLAFEWNKTVINEICNQFQCFSIGLTFRPHLLSISSKGFGTKLAVCRSDEQNGSPFIVFFDLSDVYRNQNKSTHFSRINLINSRGEVSDIVWHPELSDNQFCCSLTDGSVFLVSIGDSDTKTTTILSHIPSESNSLSLCWSPKGKQLVIGHRNGYFSQHKLVGGQQLQEVKKTQLGNGFNDYNVVAIKWIVSSLFAIAITKEVNSEVDTHVMIVSTPTKSMPTFIDFSAVCFDNYEPNGWYRINLCHFENIILCSTSMSSEVSVIGCDANKDIAVPDNWCQWVLDDSSRIDLPVDSQGNDTHFRGITVSRGTQNLYRISNSETYGGVDVPVLLVHNSAGILVPYLILDRTGRLKSPAPTPITKTEVSASPMPQLKPMTSTPIVPINTGIQTNVIPKSSISSFGSPVTPVLNMTATQQKLITKSESQPMPTLQTKLKSSAPPTQQIASTGVTATDASESSPKKQSTVETANELYSTAIKEQILEFNGLMAGIKKKYSQMDVKIGEKEEQMKLKNNTRLLEEVLIEIKENFKNCMKDTTTLQSSLIESFSLLEEAKSIMDRNVDPKYRYLLRQRALDPITDRRMQEINNLNDYIEIQLRELENKFEQEWYEWLDKRKALKANQPNRVNANSNLELIYKTLANNQRVINSLRLKLETLEGLSSPLRFKSKIRFIKEQTNESQNKQTIDQLSDKLKNSSIKELSEEIPSERLFKVKTMSKEKKESLRAFFENRPKVPVRRSVDNSSHFISAIQKIKEKQKSIELNRLKQSKVESNAVKQTEKTKASVPLSMDKPVVKTTTVIEKAIPRTPAEKAISQQKLDLKLTPLSALLKDNSNTDKPMDSLKTNATKPNQLFDSFASKPLSFNLGTTAPFVSEQKSVPTPAPTFTTKSLPTTSVVSNVIQTKPKPSVDSVKTSESLPEMSSHSPNISKTVSFGNTTIIPTETADNDYKLDTITELSEFTETSATNSPFTSFKGFGSFAANESTDTSFPKLSFNLSQSPNSFSFNTTQEPKTENISKPKELPKYEDISPPTTPQTETSQPLVETPTSAPIGSIESSKPASILKTTISTKTLEQTENKTPLNAPQTGGTSLLSALLKSEPTVDTQTTAATANPTGALPFTSISSTPSFLGQPQNPTSFTISTKVNEQNAQKSDQNQITSPFSSSGFGQTPFASNSFSFGNTTSTVSTASATAPAFGGQGLTFGGTTGFGANQTTTATTQSAGGLSFGQQTTALNSLSFCGLGGRPNAENAQKNTFGGAFSSPPLQTSTPQGFTTAVQSSPFTAKTSPAGAFGGSFTSGSAGVAQTGFAAFQASPQQTPQQSTQPAFGGSPMFAGTQPNAAFGGSPTFGGSPQQSAFGSAPTFGGPPPLGSMSGSVFGTQPTFGQNSGFAAAATNTGLSFGALASNVSQSGQMGQQNTTPFSSGFSSFGSSDSFSFTQRRK